jgi:hypothetical protein
MMVTKAAAVVDLVVEKDHPELYTESIQILLRAGAHIIKYTSISRQTTSIFSFFQ